MLEDVFAAAHAACLDETIAAEVTRRVLVAHRDAAPEDLRARGALLAAHRAPHYAPLAPQDRDAVVLARVLGWRTDRIARQLGTTPADVRARIGRGLRTLLLPPGCVGAASRARDARAS